MGKIETLEYKLNTVAFGKKLKFAIVCDLHSRVNTDVDAVIDILKNEKPEYILMPGDIFERLDGSEKEHKRAGFSLLERAVEIAPVFYSVGNHENGGISSWNILKWMRIECIPKYFDAQELDAIWNTGATFLDDGFVIEDGIAFGGLSSGLINQGRKPCLDWLDEFCMLECPKVLLCHHPEYYEKYLKNRNIDLIVSGHAHGGQWRIFGRGVFAPGQGLFPKYTSGVHDGRFVISKGLKKGGRIPRIFNRPEVVIISVN